MKFFSYTTVELSYFIVKLKEKEVIYDRSIRTILQVVTIHLKYEHDVYFRLKLLLFFFCIQGHLFYLLQEMN